MNIKRFVAKSSREALNMVRNELGEDATIISNRLVNGENEILAVCDQEMNALINSARQDNNENIEAISDAWMPKAVEVEPQPINRIAKRFDAQRIKELAAIFNTKPAARKQIEIKSTHPVQQIMPSETGPKEIMDSAKVPEMKAVINEIREMRDLFASQLTEISWGATQQRSPTKKELLRTMLSAGFSAGLAKRVADKCPLDYSKHEALPWAKDLISRNLKAVQDESDILDTGGVYALIGPTGVGKTTTVAKMAARYVMKHGAENLALITTDAYRIGGHEQLRIYAEILGVGVHAVKDENDLKLALNMLKGRHTVLIDTVGLSQKDAMVGEQIAMLFNADRRIKKLLCLNASNTIETLNDVANAYLGKGLDGCIITKADEAVTVGGVLNVIMQHKLKVFYLTNGQRVPEDIHLADKDVILYQAFNASNGHVDLSNISDDDLPAIVAQSSQEPKVNHA